MGKISLSWGFVVVGGVLVWGKRSKAHKGRKNGLYDGLRGWGVFLCGFWGLRSLCGVFVGLSCALTLCAFVGRVWRGVRSFIVGSGAPFVRGLWCALFGLLCGFAWLGACRALRGGLWSCVVGVGEKPPPPIFYQFLPMRVTLPYPLQNFW